MTEQPQQHLTLVEVTVGMSESGRSCYGLRTRLGGLDAEAQGMALGTALRAVHDAIDHCQAGMHAGAHADFWGGIEAARSAGVAASQETIRERSEPCDERNRE